MIHAALRPLLLSLLLAGCGAAPEPIAAAPLPATGATPGLATAALRIQTARGVRRFTVEIAATPAQQERGLMHRPTLPRDRGMLFPFPAPREATFWMKNTPAPLDLLFIRADGSIARIAAMAIPNSLDLIPSGEPVSAVLEIAGGNAARLGIAEGDVVAGAGLPMSSSRTGS
jgi:uncharacterized membrane protein (UPF0127 family)